LVNKRNNIIERKAVLVKGNELLGQAFIEKLDQSGEAAGHNDRVNFNSLVW